ncbi:hypothetical protein BKA93DRAFT_775604 [Sparassis latifolia]|uniref:Uncharacterized protein n=1 Tax=Sparassis crispa TaxID=139825 RepID=A0A401GVT7_9APHY|nr:hypothetical protein SCP_0902050 [Sparassis crispa]GBE86326.1 hypothetical protein SCP_0902050 [Sparassis crispa]
MSRCKGSNGFTDPTRSRVRGDVVIPNVHIGADTASATSPTRRAFRDAIEQRMFAEDMLQLRGTYFPGLAAAKGTNEHPETAASVKDRVTDLERRHAEELLTMFEWQAEDHLNNASDLYQCKYDLLDKNGRPDNQLESFYRMSECRYSFQYDDALSAISYAHHSTILPLQRSRIALIAAEEDARRRRDAQFPSDITKYHEIRSKDVQVRIALFLMADSIAKERMLTKFGWAWRQVQNLIDEYDHNTAFKVEVHDCVRDVEARDPRRRPSLASVV